MDICRPDTIAHGEHISAFPLFPWSVALLYKTGIKMEFCLRFMSIFSIAVTALIIWSAAKNAVDEEAAAVAAASYMTFILVVEKGLDGYPDFMGNAFVFSAWLLWFSLGVAKGRWNLAWILSTILCLFAFFTIGWKAPLYFFIPLIFMRRPMTIWSRLKKPGFAAAVLLIILSISFWYGSRWALEKDLVFRKMPIEQMGYQAYFSQILIFPFELIIRFMPWTIFAWPAFCAAYHPVERNPVFSRFLRIIFISLFFFLWLLPSIDWRDVTILAAPLALLVGMNYSILVRRHGRILSNMIDYLFYPLLAFASAIFIFYVIPLNWIEDLMPLKLGMSFHEDNRLLGLLQTAAAVYIFYVIKRHKGIPLWSRTLCLFLSFSLCYWALLAPYQAMENSSRLLAMKINEIISFENPDNEVIYKDSDIAGLYAACLYTGYSTKKLRVGIQDIPDKDKTVFLLASNFPNHPGRNWENISGAPVVETKGNKLYIWKGTIILPPSDEKSEDNETGNKTASDGKDAGTNE